MMYNSIHSIPMECLENSTPLIYHILIDGIEGLPNRRKKLNILLYLYYNIYLLTEAFHCSSNLELSMYLSFKT